MADYYPLLAKAVAAQAQSDPAKRRAIYERARTALLGQLRAIQPPVPEPDIERESQALDEAINRLEGTITDVSYLGALTIYKVRLDSGATLRSSMANTARIDIDAYNLSQRVVAWFTPDDCLVLEQ